MVNTTETRTAEKRVVKEDGKAAAEMRGFLLRTRESQSRPYQFKTHDLFAALIAAALVVLGALL